MNVSFPLGAGTGASVDSPAPPASAADGDEGSAFSEVFGTPAPEETPPSEAEAAADTTEDAMLAPVLAELAQKPVVAAASAAFPGPKGAARPQAVAVGAGGIILSGGMPLKLAAAAAPTVPAAAQPPVPAGAVKVALPAANVLPKLMIPGASTLADDIASPVRLSRDPARLAALPAAGRIAAGAPVDVPPPGRAAVAQVPAAITEEVFRVERRLAPAEPVAQAGGPPGKGDTVRTAPSGLIVVSQAEPAARPATVTSADAPAELARLDFRTTETRLPEADSPRPVPELARGLIRQLTEAVRLLPDRPVEVSLSPEELGRVRLTLVTDDTGISVNISAERGETLDLIRRHLDQLGQEFRRAGFSDVAFSFSAHGGGDAPTRDEAPARLQPAAGPENPAEGAGPTPARRVLLGTALDLRL